MYSAWFVCLFFLSNLHACPSGEIHRNHFKYKFVWHQIIHSKLSIIFNFLGSTYVGEDGHGHQRRCWTVWNLDENHKNPWKGEFVVLL